MSVLDLGKWKKVDEVIGQSRTAWRIWLHLCPQKPTELLDTKLPSALDEERHEQAALHAVALLAHLSQAHSVFEWMLQCFQHRCVFL